MNPLPLTAVEPESEVVVDCLRSSATDCIRLQRLGICDGNRIIVAQTGDPLIVLVVGSRIGISRKLAEQVFVRKA